MLFYLNLTLLVFTMQILTWPIFIAGFTYPLGILVFEILNGFFVPRYLASLFLLLSFYFLFITLC